MGQAMSMQMNRALTIAPALQKSLRLLQMNALEFEQAVRRALDENPMLEDDSSGHADDAPASAHDGADESAYDGTGYTTDGYTADAALQTPTADSGMTLDDAGVDDRRSREVAGATDDASLGMAGWGQDSGPARRERGDAPLSPIDTAAADTSLREHLLLQVGSLPLSDLDRVLATVVVDSVDPSGYLAASIDELVELARTLLNEDENAGNTTSATIDASALQCALARVQALEPAGVAARSVAECLQLQLRDLPDAMPGRTTARRIITGHLDLLASNEFRVLAQTLAVDDGELGAAVRLIRSLDPKPGLAFGGDLAAFAVPEVVVRKVDGRWVARLHPSATPRVRINAEYADIVSRQNASSDNGLGQQLQEAHWLLRSIAQRADTIEATAAAIVARQQAFFEYGDIGLKPMRLSDIAEDIGVHESTVSRVVNSKYLQSPRGLVPLRRFFTSHVETATGTTCSATAVKAMIRLLIDGEQATDPHSDHRLTRLLMQRGIRISRRTVTKYRDALGIEAADLRRQLAQPPADSGARRSAARTKALRRVTRRSPDSAAAAHAGR